MTVKTWDIETGIKSALKRKGTPFGGLNHCVLHGWRALNEPARQVHSHYFGHSKPGPGWLAPVLDGTRLLVGFNIKFDLLHALQDHDNLEQWMAYVASGGQIWDCQLAEYLLNGMGQTEHMLSLDEVAPRYGGNLKFDEVKALWNAGVDTADIEPALLTRYLCGATNPSTEQWEQGDVENTEQVFRGQIKRAREAGQLNSIMLNMGSLLCTIEMERNGMYIDKARGLVLAEELAKQIETLRVAMESFLPEDMPCEFKWTSPFHKSALIFGGRIKYDRREYLLADGTYTFEENAPTQVYTQKEVIGYYFNGEVRVPPDNSTFDEEMLAEHAERYKSGKNAGECKTKRVKVDDLSKPKSRMGEDYIVLPGFTAPSPKWERSDYPGVYSTASEVIEELGSRNVPFLKQLAKLQDLTKDLSTYYIVVDEDGNEKGMLSLVDPHGIIHHKINHTSTVTGRFSSSDPNLQNVAKGVMKDGVLLKGSQVKTVFVSRFPDGKIIQSDFTALEVYVQAILTQCKQLIADLQAGLDMHCVRVSQKENLPYDEVLKLCKGYEDADGKWVDAVPEWDKKRTEAKVFSFQRAYGAGAQKIADSTGMKKEDVEALIAAEQARYPEVDEYYDNLTKQIARNRRPGVTRPHPEVRGVMCNLGVSHFRTPDGKLYQYQEQPAPEFLVKRGTFQSFSPTEIKNYVVQGEGGEWAKAAMWLAVRAFYARRNFGHLGLLVNQVHDALYADADKSVALEAAALLHACMEAASEFMEWFFKWPVPVPVPSDTTWGASMMEEERIAEVKELAKPLRQQLRAEYMAGYVPSFETK